MSLANCRQTQ